MRTRTTAAGVAVVSAALAVGTLAFTAMVRNRVVTSIEAAAAARADALVAMLDAGAIGATLPPGDPELLAQVVDAAGDVVAADSTVRGLAAFTEVDPAEAGTTLHIDDLFEEVEDALPHLEDESPYAVVTRPVAVNGSPGLVMVAATLEDATDAVGAALPILLGGSGALVVLVGLMIWLLTGRALRPVEHMRTEAHRISGTALDVRLPIPRTSDEIHGLAVTLNAMLDRLEASVVSQRRFASDASHELRSPLAALRTMVEVGDEDAVVAVAHDAIQEIARMERLVDDLLYLAGHDEAAPPGRREEVDLDQIAGTEAAALAGRADCAVDTAGIGPARMLGDPARLGQLVRNLIDNAARHAGSTVWVRTGTERGEVVLEVSDDGPGIRPDDRDRVFDRFVRLDTSRARTTGGAGLGLAVARSIARDHGGDLSVGDSRRGGATLLAVFPDACCG